jgi:chemotaxis protein CheD
MSAAQAHFAHIERRWDPQAGAFAAKLLPGDYYVTSAGEMIWTVLGSCVSACIRDKRLGFGGMNHFMLPLDASDGKSAWSTVASASTRYGNVAMERLVNDIFKLGGRREDLEVKLIGGGRVLAAMTTDIGARNIEFVRCYVREEGFTVLGEDLGDVYPRKVQYFPESGRIRVKRIVSDRNEVLLASEQSYRQNVDRESAGGSVDLF